MRVFFLWFRLHRDAETSEAKDSSPLQRAEGDGWGRRQLAVSPKLDDDDKSYET